MCRNKLKRRIKMTEYCVNIARKSSLLQLLTDIFHYVRRNQKISSIKTWAIPKSRLVFQRPQPLDSIAPLIRLNVD